MDDAQIRLACLELAKGTTGTTLPEKNLEVAETYYTWITAKAAATAPKRKPGRPRKKPAPVKAGEKDLSDIMA